MQGGNPSSTWGTFIGVAPNAEGIPQYKKMDWGASCQLSPPGEVGKVLLANDVLADLRYQLVKSALLAPDAPFSSNACRDKLAEKDIDRTALRFRIDQLNVYNGLLSTISQYDAGAVLSSQLEKPDYVSTKKGGPVCEIFLIGRGKKAHIDEGTTAAAQAINWSGRPAMDIYVNPYGEAMKKGFRQGTIVHEALHTFTGLAHEPDDSPVLSLDNFLGKPADAFPQSYPGESNLTRRIREMSCAAAN